MNFGYKSDAGCGCHGEMNMGINNAEPIMKIVKCKKHDGD